MSVTLSQDTASSLTGINLKWVYSVGMGTVKEISLIYFQNGPDSDILGSEIASGLLKTNLSASLFSSGMLYSFQLQVMDTSGVISYSNTISLSAPWSLSAPVISSTSGYDAEVKVQLAPSSDVMSSSDTTVEFVIRRDDAVLFWVVKPFTSSGLYSISNGEYASMVNDKLYRIACCYQPSVSNTRYNGPSPMSNSVTCTPKNTPNAISGATQTSVGFETYDIRCDWLAPSDILQWRTGGYTVNLQLKNTAGVVVSSQSLINHGTSYTWIDVPAGFSYYTCIQYTNSFGDGPVGQTASVTFPRKLPQAPYIVGVSVQDSSVSFSVVPHTDNGQAGITHFEIFKGDIQLGTFPFTAGSSSYDFTLNTGLTNGESYSFTAKARNPVGPSAMSDPVTASPFGQMSIVSCVPSGKTLTLTLRPNGRPIKGVIFVALDNDPSAEDGDMVFAIPQSNISQSLTSNVVVAKTFSSFSSNIKTFCAIANSDVNSAFVKADNVGVVG
jgi:hypothetical protein